MMWRRWGMVSLAGVLLSGCWLQPGFDGRHSRANDLENRLTVDNVDTLRELWSVPVGAADAVGPVPVHEPLVRGGRVYVAFSEFSETFRRRYGVSALASTGEPVWTHYGESTDGGARSTPPTLVGDALYLSGMEAGGGAGCTTRFERLDPDDGRLVTTQNVFVFGVTHSDDFIAFTHGAVCAPNVIGTTLSVRSVGAERSRFFVTLLDASVPVASGGWIFVVSRSGLEAIDARGCGADRCPPTWTLPGLGLSAVVSPVVDRADDGSPRVFVVTTSSELLAIDVTTRTVEWRASLDGTEVADLALADGTVFVATGGTGPAAGTLQAFSADGCGQPTCNALWHTAPGTADDAVAPVVAGSAVYVAAANDIRAYATDGCPSSPCTPVAEVSIGDGTDVSHIVVAEGRLYVASDGRLTAFAPDP
jgi:hypothetical protein